MKKTSKRFRHMQAAEVIAALRAANGLISIAAEHLGCTPQAIYLFRDRNIKVAQAIESIEDRKLDFAEGKLMKAISDNNLKATMFYLETKGRKRGFIKRQEFAGPDGAPPEFTLHLGK